LSTTPPPPSNNPYGTPPGSGGGFGPPVQQGQPFSPPAQQGEPFGPPAQQGQPFGMPRQPNPGSAFAAPPVGPAAGLCCRFCGSVPAVMATVRGHQGFLIMMRFLKLQGPFCRSCGIATYRDMTAKSLWQGWWGIASAIINPVTMLINLPERAKFNRLAEPVPGAPGQPMNPGKPLFRRAAILGLVVPISVIGLIVVGMQGDADYASVGDCVQNKGTTSAPDVQVVDCGSADAEFKIVGKLENSTNYDECEKFDGFTVAYTKEKGSSSYTLCLAAQN